LTIALPSLQGAAEEDREELVDLWARLLANAMDPNLNSVRPEFINAVKKMDRFDPIVLRYIHENQIAAARYELSGDSNNITGISDIARSINRREDEVVVSLWYLQESPFFGTVEHNLGFYVSAFNREFMAQLSRNH
jgi:Abortive infection alpha